MTQQLDLNSTQIEILESVFEGQKRDNRKKQQEITEALNMDKSAISRNLSSLEDRGLIERSNDGRAKRVFLTDKGYKHLLYSRSSGSENNNNLIHLHKFAVKFPVQAQRDNEDWREKLIRKTEKHDGYNEKNDSYILDKQAYTYWITKKNIVVILEDLVGQDPTLLKEKAINRAIEGARKVEEELSISITNEYSEIRAEITNQHMAIIGDPLSKLVHESEYQGCNIKIIDEEGRIRIWLDDSEDRKDLEAGTQFGTHGFTEEDIETILQFYRKILNDSESLLT